MRIKGRGIGYWFNCGDRNLSNQAPTSHPVTIDISGGMLVGSTPSVTYHYDDVNGDEEDTPPDYQWYRADDSSGTGSAAIGGATSSSYTIQGGDSGKHIACSVTVKAATGTTPGTETYSSYHQVPDGYYVKTGGNDGLDGKSDANAWATIAKVNTEIAAGNIDMTVYFNTGDTFYGALDLNQENGLEFDSYGGGANPIISGLKTIPDSWVDETAGVGANVWSYDITGLGYGNVRYLLDSSVESDMTKTAIGNCSEAGTLTTLVDDEALGILRSIGTGDDDWNGSEIVVKVEDYIIRTRDVTDYDESDGEVTFASLSGYTQESGFGYFLQNSTFILLDNATNDEWCLESDSLYIYQSVGAPTGIQVAGEVNLVDASYADNATFTNIDFEWCNEEVFFLNYTDNLTITGCSFNNAMRGVGGKYGSYLSFTGNTLADLSEGVCLKQFSNSTFSENDFDDIGLIPGLAIYTAFTDAGYLTGYNGINLDGCIDALVEKNNFDGIGYCGVKYYYSAGDFLIQKNYVQNHCFVLTDGAGIYLVTNKGTSITNRNVKNNIVIGGFNDGMDMLPVTDNYDIRGIYSDRENWYVNFEDNFSTYCLINLHISSTDNQHNVVKGNKTCKSRIGGNTAYRNTEFYLGGSNHPADDSKNNTITENEFITNWKTGGAYNTITYYAAYRTLWEDNVNDNTVTKNKLFTPTGQYAGFDDDDSVVVVHMPSTQEMSPSEFNANFSTASHNTGAPITYSMTGLADEYNMVWFDTNPTDTLDTVTFGAGFYYYDTDGNLVYTGSETDTMQPYTGKIYLRTIEEGLPEASSVGVSGTLFMGFTLYGVYTFSHTEGNDQGNTTFQWYRSNDFDIMGRVAISGATSQNYMTTSSDIGKYLIFGVTPVALTPGAGTGTLLTGVERFAITSSQISTI